MMKSKVEFRHKIYCLYPNPIREFRLRKKNYLYLYPQYPFVSDPFSFLINWIVFLGVINLFFPKNNFQLSYSTTLISYEELAFKPDSS
jgi:hypothetical protein